MSLALRERAANRSATSSVKQARLRTKQIPYFNSTPRLQERFLLGMDPSQASVFDDEYSEDVKPNIDEEATLVARRQYQDVKPSVPDGKIRVKIVYMGRGAFYVDLSWIAF